MKKISLLFTMLLVLVSGIIFSSCGKGYKDLKITCNVEKIELVLDGKDYYQDIIFELSGYDDWGEISIDSKPLGLVQTTSIIEGNKCGVRVTALQPTGEGATLVITHLGSGKSLSVPLNIGMKLQTLSSNGKSFVIEAPKFVEGDDVKRFDIPTKQLLNCQPTNYTDTIVWQAINAVTGVEVVSYDKNGEIVKAFNTSLDDVSLKRVEGTSQAVRSEIVINDTYDINSTLKLQPISISDDKAILYRDELDVVDVVVADILQSSDIKAMSDTHGDSEGVLKNLVLISNPDSKKPRPDSSNSGYDYYSTGNFELKLIETKIVDDEPVEILKPIDAVNYPLISKLYDIQLSTDLDALSIENVDFGKIRAIATSTCVGKGNVFVNFVPKNCVGDIKAFTINIPCEVGERATSFKATNNNVAINVEKDANDDYKFSSITPLNDASEESLGQAFKFNVLSTHTLDALSKYQIKINKHLLYINQKKITENDDGTKTSQYIKGTDRATSIDLTNILSPDNAYEFQISILKDGKQIVFYEDGDYFVSEPIDSKHTIYMKWVKINGQALGSTPFGISISNIYNNSLDIKNNHFDKTCITYDLGFNRQRTVGSISYSPIKIVKPQDAEYGKIIPDDAGDDWQFYFEPSMFKDSTIYYGIKVNEVLGLNSTLLTATELKNINLDITIDHNKLGLGLFDNTTWEIKERTLDNGDKVKYSKTYLFNFDSDYDNIIILGIVDGESLNNDDETIFGDYILQIKQQGEIEQNILDSIKVKIYKNLKNEDVSISIQNANFEGDLLQYKYVPTEPADWVENYSNYYVFSGGQYLKVTDSNWKPEKIYYKKEPIRLFDGTEINSNNTYILASSNRYEVKVSIKNEDFINKRDQEVEARMVTIDGNPIIKDNYANYLVSSNINGNTLTTSANGTYNKKQHYVKLTYTISAYSYDYYKLNRNALTAVQKDIYIYVYEPLTTAKFDHTMLYKYDYGMINNNDYKQMYGQQKLNIELNNNSSTIFDYVDIKWNTTLEGGVSSYDIDDSYSSAIFTFANNNADGAEPGRIIVTLTQFGIQYPIYCDYQVSQPISSESIIVDSAINSFKSGVRYLNFKVGESKTILAHVESSKGKVSMPDVMYKLCSTSGYDLGDIASIDSTGKITAYKAGKAKLIIFAKDQFKGFNTSNYLDMHYLADKDVYAIIDIIISDGSEANPFLIASGDDFRAIANDYYIKDGKLINNYHYALVNDIDLGGHPLTLNAFAGRISSYQDSELAKNRFTIYGVMLTENNPSLFAELNMQEDGLPSLQNINFNVDINYISTKVNTKIEAGKEVVADTLIGLIAINNAIIKDITVTISGRVNASDTTNSYIIGSISALNTSSGKIEISNTELVGVKGDIVVSNSSKAGVYLGGVVGENQGTIQGVIKNSNIEDDGAIKYEVYYDNQGAMADVILQVKSVQTLDNSAIGGIVGFNKGVIFNVYSMGQILGVDDAKNLTVNNVGGLIGKNEGTDNKFVTSITLRDDIDVNAIDNLIFNDDVTFQVVNSYSSAKVYGNDNVGGAVGSDKNGSYKKVYYEIYHTEENVKGNNNVGGLIGFAKDSNLYYCYANSFALGYKNSVEVYDIVGNTNVGGLIGRAESSRENSFTNNGSMNIIRSVASVSLTGNSNVCGIIGRLDKFGIVYISYFYGVIDDNIEVSKISPIVKLYNKDGRTIGDIAYNEVYAIINGDNADLDTTGNGIGFNSGTQFENDTDGQYNNGKPYIKYYEDDEDDEDGTSLISVVPTQIQIDQAFIEKTFDGTDYTGEYIKNTMFVRDDKGEYVKSGGKYIKYIAGSHDGLDRYTLLINPMFKPNDINGEYMWDSENYEYVPYKQGVVGSRYSLMASVGPTSDTSTSLSDYRNHVLVLYYYQFNDMSGEHALDDLYQLNIVNMHDIINDNGIIVLPNTLKRFNLRTSDSAIVSVLSGGRLLLNSEGQVTITIVSTLNPSISASFVVFVRSKVLEFNLYSSANLRDEYRLNNQTINIVKNTSKIIYTDYSSTITLYNREYAYKSATNMQVEFEISHSAIEGKDINKYITLNGNVKTLYILDSNNNKIKYQVDESGEYVKDVNGNYIIDENGKEMVDKYIYTIPYGSPITISVNEYVTGDFIIKAKPYVVINYNNEEISIPLECFDVTFNVATKKGASAINTNKIQLDMMPADDASNIDVKITTDVAIDKLYFELEAVGDKWESSTTAVRFVKMLEILKALGITQLDKEEIFDADNKVIRIAGTFTLDKNKFDEESLLQELKFQLDLNELSHYIDEAFKLQLTLYVPNGEQKIATNIYINVFPQQISSIIAKNYKMDDNVSSLDLSKAYQSQIIRPGSTNIITIDVAPSIAVYDNIEIVDLTTQDKILLQQLIEDANGELKLPDNMDKWVDSGIKLAKQQTNTSKLYVAARLPKLANANITHTLQITAYDKLGNELYTTYLNIEAVMYPSVEMIYVDPNGKVVTTADTRGTANQEDSKTADLAVGVDASILVNAYHIDEGTLKYDITITKDSDDYTAVYQEVVRIENMYGKYILQFDSTKQELWEDLLNKQINVSFSASKSLNGVTETCKATISFTIRKIVIHGISMTHTTSKNKLYGYWNEAFATEFYFDKTDISYFNSNGRFWNTKYDLDNTNPINYVGKDIYEDMLAINNLLKQFNKWNGTGVDLYLGDLTEIKFDQMHKLTKDYNDKGVEIKYSENKFYISAQQPISTDITDINTLKLAIQFKFVYNNYYPQLSNSGYEISNEFGFDVTKKTTPFDEYELLYNQADFEDMVEGRYYQLANDIDLINYTPTDVAIGGLNGDGYCINLKDDGIHKAFNIDQLITDYSSGEMNIGLFGILHQNSIIQNLKINYVGANSNTGVVINLDESSTIQQNSNNIYFGGIAAQNLGVITNVLVEGKFTIKSQYVLANKINVGGITAVNGSENSTKVATITGSTSQIKLNAIASIGGVAVNNYGKITNTNFKGKIISNKQDINQYVAEVTTAGFVVQNLRGAYISLSYVECGLDNSVDIDSVGRTAGFVLINSGTINNSYINQTEITSQGNIGGFAYQSSGDITNCYSYPSLGSSLFYNEFIYSSSNIGQVTNCYMVTNSDKNIYISGLNKINPANVTNKENYSQFIFAQGLQGVWDMAKYGPTLQHSGFNNNKAEYSNTYNIYDVETYQGFFNNGRDDIEGRNYRLVRDIDFEAEGFMDNPITVSKVLRTSFEGNDMALINYNIFKITEGDNIGLFASIIGGKTGLYVRNLILKPASIKASGIKTVGALAGVIDSANLYNIVVDNSNLLILGRNAVGGLAGLVKGSFEIVGINANVSVFATYTNTTKQYNLYTGKNVIGNSLYNNIQDVSYAGSIVGIIDGYDMTNPSMISERKRESYYSISNININQDITVIAETVGGAFGLVGERTLVKEVNYNLSNSTIFKGVYVSGGLVGENRGIIQSSNIYAIDKDKKRVDTSECFNGYARINGAIVGLNIGGLIDNCTSNIDVNTSKQLSTVGGIVGRNIEGSIYSCKVLGYARGFFAGGIAGTDYSYQTVINQRNDSGSPTFNTLNVYNNIKGGVSYNSNCLIGGGYNKDYLYKNNSLTKSFMDKFWINQSQYYTFNPDYIDNHKNGLIEVSSLFGLVVGLTDGSYNTTISCNSNVNNPSYEYKDEIFVTLNKVVTNLPYQTYKLLYEEQPIEVDAISNIVAEKLTYPLIKAHFIYVIGYSRSGYENWSATLGYTNDLVIVSPEQLAVV